MRTVKEIVASIKWPTLLESDAQITDLMTAAASAMFEEIIICFGQWPLAEREKLEHELSAERMRTTDVKRAQAAFISGLQRQIQDRTEAHYIAVEKIKRLEGEIQAFQDARAKGVATRGSVSIQKRLDALESDVANLIVNRAK
jgi:hypothetical protein